MVFMSLEFQACDPGVRGQPMQLFELKDGDGRNGACYIRGFPPAAPAPAFRPLTQGGGPE